MTKEELFEQIKAKQSFLCVGLDSDIHKIPSHLLQEDDPVFEFNKAIIDATADLCVAYKPNTAFYEARGAKGWLSLEKTIDYIPSSHFIIADAKRGDIGNTSSMYAESFFGHMNCDALTVAPYMGIDSVSPFLEYSEKWVILLVLTSNKGSADFQQLISEDHKLYEHVIRRSSHWAGPEQLMFVIGATHPEAFRHIRKIAPEHFFLVPGVGAQGGDLKAICRHGLNAECGLLVNSSRGIIFAGKDISFADAARQQAALLRDQMKDILLERKLI